VNGELTINPYCDPAIPFLDYFAELVTDSWTRSFSPLWGMNAATSYIPKEDRERNKCFSSGARGQSSHFPSLIGQSSICSSRAIFSFSTYILVHTRVFVAQELWIIGQSAALQALLLLFSFLFWTSEG
jgi:hypothetical protein